MALIDCINCGGTVSDQAIECPHCGYNKKIVKNRLANALSLTIIGYFFISLLIFLSFEPQIHFTMSGQGPGAVMLPTGISIILSIVGPCILSRHNRTLKFTLLGISVMVSLALLYCVLK